LLLSASSARADVSCPSGAAISIAYECDTIPEESPTGAWEVQVRHPASWWSDGEYLHLDAFDPLGEVIFYRVEESLATSKRYEIEVNVSVSRYLPPPDNPTVGIGISDGTKLAKAEAGPDIGIGELTVEGTGEPFVILGIDWSQPVTVRWKIDRTASDPAAHSAELYVKGALRLTIPYQELPDTDPSVPPLIFAIGGRGTDSVWDFARYAVCQPPEERPPLAQQVDALKTEVEALDMPPVFRVFFSRRLDQALAQPDRLSQAQAFYRIGRELFFLKRAGLLRDDAAAFETLLDFARTTAAPEVGREEGYFGRLELTSVLPKSSDVVPGKQPAAIRVFATVRSALLHGWNASRYAYGLMARTGIVDIGTGEMIEGHGEFYELPSNLAPGQQYQPEPMDFEWAGNLQDGSLVRQGEQFFVDTTVGYVIMDRLTGQIAGHLDQSSSFGEIGSTLQSGIYHEVFRHYAGRATPTTNLVLGESLDGRYFIHTDGLVSDNPGTSCDPVMHVLNSQTGSQLAGNDDCISGMETCIRVGGACLPAASVSCRIGSVSVACPSVAGTRNACLMQSFSNQAPRIVLHAYGNQSSGRGLLKVWKKIEDAQRRRITYQLALVPVDVDIGGERLWFSRGWYSGDELDLIVPSPERARSFTGLPPARSPTVFLLGTELTGMEGFARGNGMGGGARMSGMPGRSQAMAVVASGVADGAVELYVNDVRNAAFGDGDGLGAELEGDIGTDPDNRDTDGDGLWDGFEVLGIRGAGLYPDQALPTWGADPRHKDVFVETDYFDFCSGESTTCIENGYCRNQVLGCKEILGAMRCACTNDDDCWSSGGERAHVQRCRLIDGSMGYCVACGGPMDHDGAVAANTIAAKCSGGSGYLHNPDGRKGFSLHFDNGQDDTDPSGNLMSTIHGAWGGVDAVPPAQPPIYPWSNYEWGYYHRMNPIRHGIFRYAVGYPGGGGQGAIGGPYAYFNSFANPGHLYIHELGHNFGLDHYGATEPGSNHNFKPHYISLMNYRYEYNSPDARTNNPWAWGNLRFSEGERRYVLDSQGRRIKDAQGNDVVHWLDPVELREASESWTNVVTDKSNVRFDLENGAGYYNIFQGDSELLVDWDRSGAYEDTTRADPLLNESAWFKYSIADSPLRFGPQLVAHDGFLYAFQVRETASLISYQRYFEVGCDPEDVGDSGQSELPGGHYPRCGQWFGRQVIVRDTDVATDMSAVSTSLAGSSLLLLMYVDSSKRLCVLSMDPFGTWDGPACGAGGLFGPPEAVEYAGGIMVFGIGEADPSGEGQVKVVYFHPGQWSDPTVWTSWDVNVMKDSAWRPLRSRTTPGVVVDPHTRLLLGITTTGNHEHRMELFQSIVPDFIWFEKLKNGEYWMLHPKDDSLRNRDGAWYYTDYRPALDISYLASGRAHWSVWIHGDTPEIQPGQDPVPNMYWRITSSIEDPGNTGNPHPAFSLLSDAAPASSARVKNVSLAVYRGKLRAAVAFDQKYTDELQVENDPGWMFLPLADGIFHARLMDFNDVEYIGRHMADTIGPLFFGMAQVQRAIVINENHLPQYLGQAKEVESPLRYRISAEDRGTP
jgi:hypothetical protein